MSFIEDEGKQQEEEEQDYDSIFQFFFQFTKPLLLELPSPEDRTLAAVWIQRLQMESETEEEKSLRADYLKLLLFVMQRGRLIGFFKNEPPSGPLQPFPEGLGLTEMGNFLLDQAELQGSGDADMRKVSYNVEISNDLREFVAAQEIPDFGIQVYYAWSVEDPIYKWMSFDENKFPQHVRDKIKQLKTVQSEEKSYAEASCVHGERSGSLRKSCDSTLHEKNRAKVKSPEEIEKSLERNRHSLISYNSSTNNSSQRGSAKDKAFDDDNTSSSPRKCRNHSPDELSMKETGTSKLCGQEYNTEENYDEDITGGMRRERSCPCYSEYASRHVTGGFPDSNSKRDADTHKRLQKCDDVVENGSTQMKERSYMAGPSQRITDKCHGKEMYSESARCGGEAAPPEKPPCSSAREYQMSQAISQPSMKSRKTRYTAQAYQSQQDGLNEKCVCTSTMKASTQAKSQCSYPCPKAEKEISQKEIQPCSKKKEKSQLEPTFPKSKPLCPESMAAKRPQVQPCTVIEEGMKTCSRKMHVEPPEGCTCGEDRHKHHIENLNRIEREKMMSEQCPQEVPPQQQQYTCSRKKSDKRDKRPTEQPEPAPGPCSKNRPVNADGMKRRGEAFKELSASQRPQQPVNASCCQQGTKLQDNRSPGRPCMSDYPANGLGPYSRNQEAETKMHGRPAREGEYMDKRCETETKEMKHSQRQGQECPGTDYMPCTGKKMPPHQNYPCFQEPVHRPCKMCANMCLCDIDVQNLNREEDLCDNGSSGSDENYVEDCYGPDDADVDPNNNPEECPIDYNANEEGHAECSSSSENVPNQNYCFYDATEYPKLPSKIRPGFGLKETPNKYLTPGCGSCPGAEQAFPQQQGQAPFMTPVHKQKYIDKNYTLPSRRKKAPDPRDFPSCNKLESPQNSRYIITSTPVKDAVFQPFAYSPVSTIPQHQRSRCGQWEAEDNLMPVHLGNQGGRTYSCHKENVPGRRKKTSQELECSRGSPMQLQYMTLQDEDLNESTDVGRMHCAPGNLNDPNANLQSQKWLDQKMKLSSCYYRRG